MFAASALLGMSDRPSIPFFPSIHPTQPSRGISHTAQRKRILIPEAGVGPGKRNRGWVSIPHFTAKFPLTYKIPLSYTLTVEKEILINSISIQSRSPNYGSRMIRR
ncbi:MAG: hypothetical protein FP814_07835 [Desulfobacterium sp.]|nr:hypothetical protein [Desulfobacterium sp.]